MQRPKAVQTILKGHADGICFALPVTPTREVLSHSQQLIGIRYGGKNYAYRKPGAKSKSGR